MLNDFLAFCIDVLNVMMECLRATELGGFTLENVLVSILILTIIIRVIIVKVGDM